MGFCFINPEHDSSFIIDETKRCIAENNLCGIKLEATVNARDDRLENVMRMAVELNVPVLHHTWYKTVRKLENESDPSDIAVLAKRWPDTVIIMAHLTAIGIQGVHDVLDCPNVFIDTSGSQPFSGVIEYAVEILGAERILFGSDTPVRDFPVQLGRIFGADISEADRQNILCGNVKRILNMHTSY